MPNERTKKQREAWNRFADVGRAMLVGSASILPRKGGAERLRAGSCLIAVKLADALLKRAIPEERPDREDDKSFPSEHAAECAAAAIIIQREYGKAAGGLACALAGAVAASRIASRKHHPHDVLAGALIGCASVWLSLRIHVATERKLLRLIS